MSSLSAILTINLLVMSSIPQIILSNRAICSTASSVLSKLSIISGASFIVFATVVFDIQVESEISLTDKSGFSNLAVIIFAFSSCVISLHRIFNV